LWAKERLGKWFTLVVGTDDTAVIQPKLLSAKMFSVAGPSSNCDGIH